MKQDDVVEVVRKDSLRIAKERLQKARDDITQSIQDIIDLQTDTLSAQHSDLAKLPLGAIENGREFRRRLVEHYSFTDDHGHKLAMVVEWQELEKCFETLVEALRSLNGGDHG